MLYCARIAASKDFYDLQANFFLSALFCALLMWSRRTAFFTALPAVLKSLFRVLAGASFALYLLHYSIIELLRSFGIGKAQVAVLAIVTANVLAVLIYLVFDKNHKKLGMRLRKMAAPAVKSSGDAA
jgi:peptidoglycan/LPS O-acetylase OafA/YrhL